MILEYGYKRCSNKEKTMNSPVCNLKALQQWNKKSIKALHTVRTSELEVLETLRCTLYRK